ncbi:hypothetical protein FQQ78_12035 [Salmonella enterica]|nr:hypothetical protein [Salmonella enterica]ECJ9932392.1 hypothetical protein [Salmonella enterica]ECQ0196686.1 hypothetical protein [Salmonella enterica]
MRLTSCTNAAFAAFFYASRLYPHGVGYSLRDPRASLDTQVILSIIMFATLIGLRLENGICGHSRFCNTDFDDIQEKSLPFTKPVF